MTETADQDGPAIPSRCLDAATAKLPGVPMYKVHAAVAAAWAAAAESSAAAGSVPGDGGEALREEVERLCVLYGPGESEDVTDEGEHYVTIRELRAALAAAAPRPLGVPGQAIDAPHLERQRDWSRATFGPGHRTAGVLDHIRKELGEIEADPLDVNEWVDVVILALDGAWRTGTEPQQIIDAIRAKQARNEARTWPDWRTMSEDQAIEHVRPAAASAPVGGRSQDEQERRPQLLVDEHGIREDSE